MILTTGITKETQIAEVSHTTLNWKRGGRRDNERMGGGALFGLAFHALILWNVEGPSGSKISGVHLPIFRNDAYLDGVAGFIPLPLKKCNSRIMCRCPTFYPSRSNPLTPKPPDSIASRKSLILPPSHLGHYQYRNSSSGFCHCNMHLRKQSGRKSPLQAESVHTTTTTTPGKSTAPSSPIAWHHPTTSDRQFRSLPCRFTTTLPITSPHPPSRIFLANLDID